MKDLAPPEPTQPFFDPAMELRQKRSVLGAFILLLIVILAILLALYWVLTKPPAPVVSPKTPGINHIFTLFGPKKGDYLNRPDATAVDERGNIYVADSGNHRIVVFNRRGAYLRTIGKEGVGKGKLKFPLGIAVDKKGRVYTATMGLNKILIYSPAGKFIKEFKISKDTTNDIPIQLRIKDDRLYATASGRVVIMDLNGKVLKKWGRFGKRLGEFAHPNGLDIAEDGRIFIGDGNNSRIQIFEPKGKLVAYKGNPPKDMRDADRMFGLNLGLALDEEGRVFVVDALNSSIRIFDKQGEELGELGEDGSKEGQLHVPAGITHVSGSLFLVADKWNNRVQMLELIPPVSGARPSRPLALWFWPLIVLLVLISAYTTRRLTAGRRAGPAYLGH